MNDPRQAYQQRFQHNTALGARLETAQRRLSLARLTTFGLAVAFLFWGLWMLDSPRVEWLVASGATLLAFMLLVLIHGRVAARAQTAARLADINRDSLARLGCKWELFPWCSPPTKPEGPLADDLDLFGKGSLFHLLLPYGTPFGRRTLAHWLQEGASREELLRRQEAVRELASKLDLRQQIQYEALGLACQDCATEDFNAWCKDTASTTVSPLCRVLSWLLPLLLVLAVAVDLLDLLDKALWPPFLLLNVVLTLATAPRVNRAFDRLDRMGRNYRPYAGVIQLQSALAPESALLRDLTPHAPGSRRSPYDELVRLDDLASFAELRRSPMLHLPLQFLFLWDLQVLRLVNRWQRGAGTLAPNWLANLGQFEALAALAGLSYDHPDWCLPELSETPGAPLLTATNLAHPLLPPERRVGNDMQSPAAGGAMLICGSNMSGKTTFLRTIGINAVLAQAGGPVCASSLTLTLLRLASAINIKDSLKAGESYFFVELLRLRDALAVSTGDPRPLLCLLDEPLRGTNYQERTAVLRLTLQTLLERGAAVALTSHDPEMLKTPALLPRLRLVHFCEQYEDSDQGPRMTFDYRLREGPSGPGNALKLLKILGMDRPL